MQKTVPILAVSVLVLAGLGYAVLGLVTKGRQAVRDQTAESVAETIINNATGRPANVDVANGTINVTTTDGSAAYGVGTKLHASFPTAVPIPTNASLVTSYAGSENGKSTHAAIFTASQSATALGDSYRTQLEQAGFTIDAAGSTNISGAVSTGYTAQKGRLTVNVAVTGNGSGATLTLAIVEE